MSAPITTRLFRLRPTTTTTLHSFSTTPNNPPIFPQPGSERDSPNPQNQSRTNPFDPNQQTHFQNQPKNNFNSQNQSRFSFSQKNQSLPRVTKAESLEKITQNLSQYRSRTAPPVLSNKQGMSISSVYKNTNSGLKPLESSFLSRFDDKFKSQDSGLNSGGVGLSGTGNVDRSWVSRLNKEDLGSKLKALRPEKRMGEWFSIQELSDRLERVKENVKKEMEMMRKKNNYIGEMRDLIYDLQVAADEKLKAKSGMKLDALGKVGLAPTYMLYPPKEELFEQYFHPDNMSSAEKMKLELKKVRDEFKMSESDCGSARVQVAQLTTKIKHLSTVLAKKDKHSRKGLQEMVQKRKKLLKYLRRTDWDSYSLVLSKLGLRDNPEIKAELVKKTESKGKKEKNKSKKKKKKLLN